MGGMRRLKKQRGPFPVLAGARLDIPLSRPFDPLPPALLDCPDT